jgi:hypothetical protein
MNKEARFLNNNCCITPPNQREHAIQCLDAFLHVVTAIPAIDNHDANAVLSTPHLSLSFSPPHTHFVMYYVVI